jgi:4a-hydroxytetrahydrobiopterin dehydratase
MIDVVLYTRRQCSLCEEAKEAISRSGVAVRLEEVDIDSNRELHDKYTDDVPVILVNGVEAFRHRVDARAFADYVSGRGKTDLAGQSCTPCRGGVPALHGQELADLARQLGGEWRVVNEHHLEKSFSFPDFVSALSFTNAIGAVAEREGHHPDIQLSWGRVGVTIWTHAIDGLTQSDFILAAKIDAISHD